MRGIISTYNGKMHWRKSKRRMKKTLLKSYFEPGTVQSTRDYWRAQFDHPAARQYRNWF